MGLSNFKIPKIRDDKHRRWIASLPCCVSGVIGRTQCAHIRTGNQSGLGLKSSDSCCVPLSVEEHARQHSVSERNYWGKNLESAQELSNALFLCTGDDFEAHKLIARFRKKIGA